MTASQSASQCIVLLGTNKSERASLTIKPLIAAWQRHSQTLQILGEYSINEPGFSLTVKTVISDSLTLTENTSRRK